ncbi:excalibur calcium-binding domain-containing protein [Bacillus rhizoplanae]|uniref:excalibur calcium-binding domain-containing protein n=1 Tax=Bacillus rhizoplanae TaxID=2880966 RepID=UPI003D1A5C3A
MAFWNAISTILFLATPILLILCFISFFKKNGKAMKFGRSAVISFIIFLLISLTSNAHTEHPILNFFANVCLIMSIFFLILAILSIFKKTGIAKKQFFITAILFVVAIVLGNIATPFTEKTVANDKQVTSKKKAKEEQNDKKKEAEKKKIEAEEQTRKQQEEQQRQAEEQARKQQEEQQRQAEEQARKQQEEQQRQAEEQARKQQEEQQRQAEEQARKQQEEQQRQAEEQARKQQEKQQPQATPAQSSGNVYYKNCSEVRAAGKAPLHAGDPGYSHKLDKDGDGIACER